MSQKIDLGRPLIRHLLYPLWLAKNQSRRASYLKDLRVSQFASEETLARLQSERLDALVRHAFDSCPFYRNRFEEAGVRPENIRSVADVRRLPTISKVDVQRNMGEMLSSRYGQKALIHDMTGGSTGSPMRFMYDKDRLESRVAATQRHNEWAGWSVGDRAALLWGHPRDATSGGALFTSIRDWVIDRRMLLDASKIDSQRMAQFAKQLQEYKPTIIQAYANTMYEFAKFVSDAGIEGITPRAIVCSAEVLTEASRAKIESVFQCKVFDRYGSREFAVIASECDRHSGLHVNSENLLIEVLVNGEPATNEVGDIVITDLRNLAMPLIRYRIGDVGALLSQKCSCGRSLPLMRLAGGRTTDFLEGVDGSRVSGVVLATYVITNLPGIQQVQFVQRQRGSVLVRLCAGPEGSPSAIAELQRRVKAYLGAAMVVEVELVNEIPLTASGKYQFSISQIQ